MAVVYNDFTAGQMRSKVLFYTNTQVLNDSGGRDDSWTLAVTTRGRLRKESGSKMNQEGEVGFSKNYELICRYQAAIPVDVKAKIVIDTVNYRIKDYKLVDEIRHFYRFILAKFER